MFVYNFILLSVLSTPTIDQHQNQLPIKIICIYNKKVRDFNRMGNANKFFLIKEYYRRATFEVCVLSKSY